MLKESTTKQWSRLYRMLICGVIPSIYDDEKDYKDIIKKIKLYKPSIILNQFTPSGIILTPEDCANLISQKDTINEEYGVDLTPWLKLAIDLDIDLVGINIDLSLIKGIKQPKHRYMFIESTLYYNILKYYDKATFDKRIAVIVSDVHLRYFPDSLYGESSEIIRQFIYNDDVLILRVADEKRIIENPIDFLFKFSKIHKTKKNKKYSEYYAYSNILFSLRNGEKYINVGKIEYMSGIFNRHGIRKNKYIEFKKDKHPVFVFFHVENDYKPFGLYEYIIKNYLQKLFDRSKTNIKILYFVVDQKEAILFKQMKCHEETEYITFLPEEKRSHVACFKIENKKHKGENNG